MTESFAIVLAGGGERVIPRHARALDRLGRDPLAAEAVIGTSAGAFVAARLTTGLPLAAPPVRTGQPDAPATFVRLAALWSALDGSVTDRRRHLGALALRHPGDPDDLVARVEAHLPDAPWPAALWIVAVDAASGERVELTSASRVPLARAVAASRAIPTVDPPVPVAGLRCIDGAIGSATNADLALCTGARTIFISSGLSDPPAPGTPEPLWAQALAREVEALEAERCRLGDELSPTSYRDPKGRAKVVRYWRMEPLGGEFAPSDEVDELRWVATADAGALLSYDHDRELLREVVG